MEHMTIGELKEEKKKLFLEKNNILDKQKKLMKAVRDDITKEIDIVHLKMNMIENKIKAIRAPDVAKNIRKTMAAIRT